MEIGGAQRLLSELIPHQARTMDVSLLVYERVNNDFEERIVSAGVNIISLDAHNFYNPAIIIKMRKILKEFDLIHAHLFPTLWWVSLAARGLKTKLVYTEHSTANARRNKPYLRPIEKCMYAAYDKVVSISQQTQDSLCCWLGENDDRFRVVCNGINTAHFASIVRPVKPKSLIMVSRFAASKDQDTVLHAMLQIDPDATLRLVGDGERLEHCKQLATQLGLNNRVEFLGTRSDVAELIAESYIGIQSSHWEGFGLTAVEIMACSKPVIGTNVDGLKQLIEGAGETFDVGDADNLAQIVNRLLADNAYYARCAKASRERAQMYDIEKMSNNYLRIYNQLA